MSFSLITLTGHYVLPGGGVPTGVVQFQLTEAIFQAGVGSVAPTITNVALDGSGNFSVNLYATNDPATNPIDAAYQVTEFVSGAPAETYYIVLPYNAPGATIDITQCVRILPTDDGPVLAGGGFGFTNNGLVIAAAAIATTNISSLSGTGTVVDGYPLAANDTVLLTAQSTGSQNGPWLVHSGAWTRPAGWFNGITTHGGFAVAMNGTTQQNSMWVLDAPTNGLVIGTDSQSWGNLTPVTGAYDALKYGVKADGATDDTAAWNALFALVTSKGGGSIYLPTTGNYSLCLGALTPTPFGATAPHIRVFGDGAQINIQQDVTSFTSGLDIRFNGTYTLTITATGGPYTLIWNEQETTELQWNASAATIQAALRALTGGSAITVTGTGPYTITQVGSGDLIVRVMVTKGTATGSSSTTLTDSGASRPVNGDVGALITAGSSTGIVTSNTATSWTVSSWTGGTPATNAAYSIQLAGGSATCTADHPGKIDCRGFGVLEMHSLTIKSGGTDDYPLIWTSNTTLRIHDNHFIGHNIGAVSSSNLPVQDVLHLGGTEQGAIFWGIDSGSATAPFQGYGTAIERNSFDYTRTGVRFQSAANANTIYSNIFSQSCGGDATHGAFTIHDDARGSATGDTGGILKPAGNVFTANLIEGTNYIYTHIVGNCGPQANVFLGDQLYDNNNAYTLGTLGYIPGTTSGVLKFAGAYSDAATGGHGPSGNRSDLVDAASSIWNFYGAGAMSWACPVSGRYLVICVGAGGGGGGAGSAIGGTKQTGGGGGGQGESMQTFMDFKGGQTYTGTVGTGGSPGTGGAAGGNTGTAGGQGGDTSFGNGIVTLHARGGLPGQPSGANTSTDSQGGPAWTIANLTVGIAGSGVVWTGGNTPSGCGGSTFSVVNIVGIGGSPIGYGAGGGAAGGEAALGAGGGGGGSGNFGQAAAGGNGAATPSTNGQNGANGVITASGAGGGGGGAGANTTGAGGNGGSGGAGTVFILGPYFD